MLPIKVDFLRGFLDDDGDQTEFALSVVKAMIESKRFFRSARGVLQFQPDVGLPRDLVSIIRVAELESILRSGLVVKLAGEALKTDEVRALCMTVLDNRWRVPSVSMVPQFAPISGVNS